MTPTEGLHYALGEIAYAVARSDGTVQREEREKFQSIVEAEVRSKDYDFEVSEIIFKMLDKEKARTEQAYKSGMDMLKLNSHYLSPHLKNTFCMILEKIAKAYPPVTRDEQQILDRFRADIAPLEGDPVYYGHA
ncbi:MAG: hypothetical protein ACJ76F_09245 [Bacteroidia bacterium]